MPSTEAKFIPPIARLQDAAEFHLCLARAFLPPREPDDYRGFTELLAGDLTDLGDALGWPVATEIGSFRASLKQVPDALCLLQLYSSLFLTPPVPAHLNLGWYLDRNVAGRSVATVEDFYRRHGLARARDFRDLSDHLATALEFLAYVYGAAAHAGSATEAARLHADAARFRDGFLLPALPALCADIEGAVGSHLVSSAYLHLARLTLGASRYDAAPIYDISG